MAEPFSYAISTIRRDNERVSILGPKPDSRLANDNLIFLIFQTLIKYLLNARYPTKICSHNKEQDNFSFKIFIA
jgi:hypothetical protein